MIHSLQQVRERVREKLVTTPVGPLLSDVTVEEGRDEDDIAFLRILVSFRGSETLKIDQLAPILELVERDLIAFDDRFPSIRIADAA